MALRRRLRPVVLALFCAVIATAAAMDFRPVAAEARRQDPPQEPAPVFRTGINLVRVDVIVTDRQGNPVTNLTQADFEVFEDGKPQVIEQFRLVEAAGGAAGDAPAARELRTRDDELLDAEREDVRVFAILLDEYHVPRLRSAAVRDALTTFIRTEVRPADLVTVMHPLEPVTTLTFTRDREEAIQEIRQFEGRRGDYTPKYPIEEQHWRNLPAIERIRTEIVLDALSALSVRLGSLREGRKSLIFVSDGFGVGGGAGYLRLRDVARDANRHNVSIYTFNPCGLLVTGEGPRGCTGGRGETLRYLAEETDGRAILNRNAAAEGLAQIARDSSAYYLIGYTSTQQANDGKFHPVRVRVKRSGVDVRARKGYWALTAEDVERATAPKRTVPTAVRQALASIDIASDAKRYVRTWIGSSRGDAGRTRVTVSWELLPSRGRQQWEQPGRLSVMAGGDDAPLNFRGGGSIEAAAQHVTFDAPPGKLDVRLALESAANGETIDREVITVDVPDLAAPALALSTPRVFVARTANEFRAMGAQADLVPIARREFLRSDRLMIRFDVYGEQPQVAAALLSWSGDRMTTVPVASAPAGGTHQIAFPLGSLAPGEYVIEITVRSADAEARELVPLRVGT